MTRFASRQAAGEELAGALQALPWDDTVLFAIPRGGVPVASAVARALGAKLDVLDTHEVTAHRDDLGIGAVDSRRHHSVQSSTAKALAVDDGELEAKLDHEQALLSKLLGRIRSAQPAVSVTGRAVIVVDDGLLVAGAALMAVEHLRADGAAAVVLAVPVAVQAVVEAAAHSFDGIVCLERAGGHTDLGDWYDDLPPITDDDIVAALTAGTD